MAKEIDTAKFQSQLSDATKLQLQLSGIPCSEGYKRDPLKYLEFQDMLNELKDTSNRIIEMLSYPIPIPATRHSA